MLSLVVPVFNEEESLKSFYERTTAVITKLSQQYEIIFIDDGSTDASLSILKELSQKNNKIKIFSFRRNQGKAEALTLGFQKAKGDIIITLDADLQDRPEEIEKLLKKSKEGYDVIAGWRANRKDATRMKIISRIFNSLMGFIWGVHLHDYNCGLKLYTRDAAKSLHLYGGMHRFIPLLVTQNGFTLTEVPVVHDKRKFGKSKYGFSKIFKDIPDMFTILFITRYGKRPLHFFATISAFLIAVGLLILLYLFIYQLQGHSIGRRPLLFVGFFSVLAGLQVFFSGFLADLMINLTRTPQLTEDGVGHFLKFSTEKDSS